MRYKWVWVFAIVFLLAGCASSQGDLPENVSKLNNLGFYYAQQARQARDAGEVQAMQENYRKAEEHFQKVLEIDLSHETARKNLALIHYEQQNYTAAEDQFERLLQLNPNNASYHYDLAIILADKCRIANDCDLNSSIMHFRRAEDIKPGYGRAQENIAALEEIMADMQNQTNSSGS